MNARTKRIWQGLVNYANATTVDVDEFRRTVTDCTPWPVVTETAPGSARFDVGLGRTFTFDPELWLAEEWQEAWQKDAIKYQPFVRNLLLWLCCDRESRDSFQENARSFLYQHTRHIGGMQLKRVDYAPDDPEHFEESGKYWTARGKPRDDSPLGVYTPSREYQDRVDPICDFLLSEYLKYRNGEYKRPVPIFICPRCKNLVMPERVGRKKYCSDCSDRARAEKYRGKVSPEENRDYQWLYRLRKAEPDLRRTRLRQPKVRKRLSEIKARQQNSSRCQNLLLEMRL